MREFDFITEKDLRSKAVENELAIAKMQMVKELLLLDGTELATTEMVANYYDVKSIETINSVIKDHREELENNGLKVYKGSELANSDVMSFKDFTRNRANYKFELNDGTTLSVGGKGITLFTKRAILNVGMLLRDSDVAIELRSRLLDIVHDADKGIGNTQTVVEEIDETTRLSMELGVAMINGDLVKCMELNAKINELKNKRITELEGTIETIKTKATTIEEFRRQANVLIKATANAKGIDCRQMWTDFYDYLENKSGYKLITRKENAMKKANEERIAQGKKPYSKSTLKTKFTAVSMIKEHEYDEVLEILKGIAVKYNVNITEKLSI